MHTIVYSPWRVEWHECGWSSRWLVLRDRFGDLTRPREILNDGYTNKTDADDALLDLALAVALGPCGR